MSQTLSVSSLDALYDALSTATGGETILLEGGDYGDFVPGSQSGIDMTFPDTVTIASADPADPAVFSSMNLRDAANLTLDGITFDYEFQSGDAVWHRPFMVTGSENITISNSTFDGDVAQGVSAIDDGYGYAVGLGVTNSTGIFIENNEFFDFHRGMSVYTSDDIEVTGNDLHSLRSDGMNFAAVNNVLIEENYIHDFAGSLESSDHADMIQFWTNGTTAPSTDIMITGNHLDIGNGTPSQAIFMRNEEVDLGRAGQEMFYQDVTITENVIVNAHRHGITVGQTDGLAIDNNSVLHADGVNRDGVDTNVEIPQISVTPDSIQVDITNNATAAINGHEGQAGWSVQNNAFVQDQDSRDPGYYGDVFVASSLQLVDGVHNFLALGGGMLDQLDAGATASHDRVSVNSDTPAVHFHVTPDPDNGALYHFDASTMDLDELPQGTTFLWSFGDGSTARGSQVSHAFSSGGTFEASLAVQLPSGAVFTQGADVAVAGPQILSYTQENGFVAYQGGVGTELAPAPGEDTVISLGAPGIAARVAREHVSDIFGQSAFNISMTLASDTTQSFGEVMRLHVGLVVSTTAEGEIAVRAFNDDGQTHVTTRGANINDTQAHNIDITYENGVLSVSVDTVVLASTAMPLPLTSSGSHDLVFGNPWNSENFDGTLSAFEITANAGDFPDVQTATVQPFPNTGAPGQPQPVDNSAEDADPQLVSYTADGSFVAYENGANIALAPTDQDMRSGIDLGSMGITATVPREHVSGIFGQETFSINMTLASDTPQSFGEVMRLHFGLVVSATSEGELLVRAFSADGQTRVTTNGANINDTQPHDISILYDNGVLSVSVDTVVLASTPMPSPLISNGTHDLVFGNPWNEENFDGTLSAFEVTTNAGNTSGLQTAQNGLFRAPDDAQFPDAFGEDAPFAHMQAPSFKSPSHAENTQSYNLLAYTRQWDQTEEFADRFTALHPDALV